MSTMVLGASGSTAGPSMGMAAGSTTATAGAQAASTSARTIIKLGKRKAFIIFSPVISWFVVYYLYR
jgi:hypothetical protein